MSDIVQKTAQANRWEHFSYFSKDWWKAIWCLLIVPQTYQRKESFAIPVVKWGCWESVTMLNETSCKVCMPFQGNQASQAGDTKTQNPKILFDVAFCSLHVMTREAIIQVKFAFYWMPRRILGNKTGIPVSLIVSEYDLNLQVFSESKGFTRAWKDCSL